MPIEATLVVFLRLGCSEVSVAFCFCLILLLVIFVIFVLCYRLTIVFWWTPPRLVPVDWSFKRSVVQTPVSTRAQPSTTPGPAATKYYSSSNVRSQVAIFCSNGVVEGEGTRATLTSSPSCWLVRWLCEKNRCCLLKTCSLRWRYYLLLTRSFDCEEEDFGLLLPGRESLCSRPEI